MNLGREIREVILTPVEVQSNEAERSFMDGSVLAHIDTAHEAHVGVVKKRFGAPVRVRGGPGALHIGDADETVEVADRRWVDSPPEEGQRERDTVQRDLVARRLWRRVGRLGREHVGRKQTRAERCARDPRHRTEKCSPGQNVPDVMRNQPHRWWIGPLTHVEDGTSHGITSRWRERRAASGRC